MNPMNAIEQGNQALIYLHNQLCRYSKYNLTLDELKRTLGTEKQIPIYLEGFGDLITQFGLSDSAVKSAMEKLADAGQGKIPTKQSIFNAIGGKAGEINWLDLTATVTTETLKEVASGAQAIGTTVIDTAKSLNVILPILLVGAVIFIVVQRSKRLAG